VSEHFDRGYVDPRKMYGSFAPEPPPPPLWRRAVRSTVRGTKWLAGLVLLTAVWAVFCTIAGLPAPFPGLGGILIGVWYVTR